MILFTGHGKIASRFIESYGGEAFSLREVPDPILVDYLKKAEVVIHNSANINPSSFIEAFHHNVLPTKRIIDLMIKYNVSARFVFLSSMSLLANSFDYKQSTDLSDYAASKFICEKYIFNSALKNFAIVRFSTIYYGLPDRDGLSLLVHSASKNKTISLINNGVAKRDFIPLDIAVEYLRRLVNYAGDRKIFNICSGKEFSFFEVAKMIQEIIPDSNIVSLVDENKSDTVLSQFDRDGIYELGILNFDLKDNIRAQVNQYANPDL